MSIKQKKSQTLDDFWCLHIQMLVTKICNEDILQFDNNMYSQITSTNWSIKLNLKLKS